MKLIGFTCTYNEAEMVPYVMPYVERMGYDKFVVYDNESTDNTVGLLKQYPFVEVRNFSTNKENSVMERTKLMAESFTEAHNYKNINNGDIVWMTWTDFDEVIFPTHLYKETLKEILQWEYMSHNVYESSLVNLFPPKEITQREMLEYVKNGYYVHEIPSLRCKLWDNWLGHKTLLIKINDFESIMCYCGNHKCGLKPAKGKTIKKIPDGLHSFHLKYLNTSSFINKLKTDNYKNNKTTYKGLDEVKFNKIVEHSYNTSYPIEYYFIMNDFKLLHEEPYNDKGVYELK